MTKKTTSGSRLDAREVVVVGVASKRRNHVKVQKSDQTGD